MEIQKKTKTYQETFRIYKEIHKTFGELNKELWSSIKNYGKAFKEIRKDIDC